MNITTHNAIQIKIKTKLSKLKTSTKEFLEYTVTYIEVIDKYGNTNDIDIFGDTVNTLITIEDDRENNDDK